MNALSSIVGILLLMLLACDSDRGSKVNRSEAGEIPETQVMMDFSRQHGFYCAPFPSDDLRRADGSIDLSGFPNPDRIPFITQILGMLQTGTRGFGLTTAVYFKTTDPIMGDNLPDIHESVSEESPVQLVGVDPFSPDYLVRYPVDTHFSEDGGPFGSTNLLSLFPLQGIPLRPRTRYAAVVLRDLLDARGKRLGVSLPMAQIAAGQKPPDLSEETFTAYGAALHALSAGGIPPEDIAGMSVFTTGDPTEQMRVFREGVLARPYPELNADFALNEVFDDYCVYESTIHMPVYQHGRPPFMCGDGGWVVDTAGNPLLQTLEEANFVLTLPRRRMPDSGFPIVVFARTGGGGERPLVDRGQHAEPGGEPVEPGSGPAKYFSKAGFAGASVDGPHGGLRNVTGGDEQFLVFNILNPIAMRDNIRQSALEIMLLAHLLENIRVAAHDCPGLTTPQGVPVTFDVDTMAVMGHSTGATIVQCAVAYEPRFRAVVLSGAGGSYVENLVYKKSPLEVKPLAELILNYRKRGRQVHEHDPALNLAQWAGEPADPPVYNRVIAERPADVPRPHILMLQGIVDTYILPPIANATSLSLGLDLAGESLDAGHPELLRFRPLQELLFFSGRHNIDLPAAGNISTEYGFERTAAVVHHREDGIEDGHEVVFQTDPPKRQYRCFLQSFAAGTPRIPPPDDPNEDCN